MARSSTKRLIFHLALTLLMMAFIFWQSSLPAEMSRQESGAIVQVLARFLHASDDTISFFVRKGAHFTEYLILGLCLFCTVRDIGVYNHRSRSAARVGVQAGSPVSKTLQPGDPRTFLLPWAIGALYAVSDELHQSFVPGRSCELRDMLIDACGVAAGVAILWFYTKNKRQC